jgi:ADP-ribose pyrophosphatase YjhB (NUDIX family)
MREKSSVVIISKEEKVLLVKQNGSLLWNLPWSRVQVGETGEQAATRVAHHLLGQAVAVHHLVGDYELSFSKDHQLVFAMEQTPEASVQFASGKAQYFELDHLPKNIHLYRKHQITGFAKGHQQKQYTIGESPILFLAGQAGFLIRKKKQ